MHRPVITDWPLVCRQLPDETRTDDADSIDRHVWLAACLVAWPVALVMYALVFVKWITNRLPRVRWHIHGTAR